MNNSALTVPRSLSARSTVSRIFKMESFDKHQGVLYVAFGAMWAEETRASIESLRKVSSLPIAVITDVPWIEDPQPEFFIKRPPVGRGTATKPQYILADSPFYKTLFVDTDTVIVIDPTPIFGLLEHYDIGVRFHGPQLNEGPNLIFHIQCNSGVILFKKCAAVDEVHRLWNDEYQRRRQTYSAILGEGGIRDQRCLAVAIAKSAARPVHLGEFLNFALFETILTYSPVVIVHGRVPRMAAIARRINRRWDNARDWGARLWMPNIRGILPAGVRKSDPVLALALVLRRVYNNLRNLLLRD